MLPSKVLNTTINFIDFKYIKIIQDKHTNRIRIEIIKTY